MRRLVVLVTAVSHVTAAGAAARGGGGVPPFPKLPGTWSHAEINVTIRRVPHTLTLDRGRIVQVDPTQVTLREAGNVLVDVPLSDRAIVTVNGRRATIFSLRRGMNAQTMQIDGGPAVRVRATVK